MREKSRPPGVATGAAQGNICNRHDTSSAGWRQAAHCELHGVNLFHRLPPRCPLGTPNPLTTLGQLQNAAWAVLGRGFHDRETPDALALLDAGDVCKRCLGRILTHPTVTRLRSRKGVAA